MTETTRTHGDHARGASRTRAVLTLVLSCDRPLEPGLRLDLADVDVVEVGRGARRELLRSEARGERRLRLSLPDAWLSSAHLRLVRVMGSWVLEDASSKNGTRVDGVRTERVALGARAVVECGHSFLVLANASGLARAAHVGEEPDRAGALATYHVPFGQDLGRLAVVATSTVPVLLLGATGTGKEVAARAVHALSRRAGPFVAVNCGALPTSLVEAELFGSKRGAYTGAEADREGLVRAAHGGTLFLDEVGDLPLSAQPTLLRVLQEREVTPVGAAKPVPVDFRLVAATHRDLGVLAEEERFRSDLLARLSGFLLELPALAERPEDLGLLLAELLPRVGALASVRLECEAARALLLHDWPHNVRELEQGLATAVALADGAPIGLEHLPQALRGERPRPAAPRSEQPSPPRPSSTGDDVLRAELETALRRHGGNISAVARDLGKARMQIQRWLKRFALDPEAFRGEPNA